MIVTLTKHKNTQTVQQQPNFLSGNPIRLYVIDHRLRTPNEGINQRNLKIWANVADKICFGCT
jgi:hypothetical protein